MMKLVWEGVVEDYVDVMFQMLRWANYSWMLRKASLNSRVPVRWEISDTVMNQIRAKSGSLRTADDEAQAWMGTPFSIIPDAQARAPIILVLEE